MGIYRCNHCKNIREYINHRSLQPVHCHNCGQEVKVYDTVFFVKNVIERYATAMLELNALKQELQNGQKIPPESAPAQTSTGENPLHGVQWSESDALASQAQHAPLNQWFTQRQIQPQFDYDAVNMSGYYDEAAEKIGENHALLKDTLGRISWAYRQNHAGLNIDLKKYSQKEGQIIQNLCRELYNSTFFTRYAYQKQDKILHLKLQSAQPIRQFFNGAWLEWFALGKMLEMAAKRGKSYHFSCARSVKIRFANEDLHELDVVFLPNGKNPLIIECKSGEYRRELDKYLALRKRLDIPASHFIILGTDLDDTQAKSLSAMYELTFATLDNLSEHLQLAF